MLLVAPPSLLDDVLQQLLPRDLHGLRDGHVRDVLGAAVRALHEHAVHDGFGVDLEDDAIIDRLVDS